MKQNGSARGGRFLTLVLVAALGGLLVVIALQARSNRSTMATVAERSQEQIAEIRELEHRTERLAKSCSRAELDLRASTEKGARLGAELADLGRRVEELDAALAAARAERDEHLAARLDLASRLTATESTLAGVLEIREALLEERAQAEVLVARIDEKVDELHARQDAARARIAEQEASLARLEGDLRAALERAVDLKGEAEAAVAAREEMARRLKEVLARLKDQVEEPESDPTR